MAARKRRSRRSKPKSESTADLETNAINANDANAHASIDVDVDVDETYDVGIVRLYCPFVKFVDVAMKMYRPEDVPTVYARGYCIFGRTTDGKRMVGTVWVDSDLSPDAAVPVLVHELSHLADDILKYAGVDDREGEARAYLMEREARKFRSRLHGSVQCPVATKKDIEKMLS